MKDTNNCAVFRDLYPSYVNEELEEETVTFMIEHLEECDSCRQWKESYKEEVDFDEEENNLLPQSYETGGYKKSTYLLNSRYSSSYSTFTLMCFWIVS